MNYGYICEGWTKSQKNVLAGRLEGLLSEMAFMTKLSNVEQPYIEVDGLYHGVRIRKITSLSEEEHWRLVYDADVIYSQLCPEDEREACRTRLGKLAKQLGYEVPARVHPDTNKELNERS